MLADSRINHLEKQSLSERIANGVFKPPTVSYYLSQLEGSQTSTPRYHLKQKRALAVELGHCLLNFFDATLDPDDIYFFGRLSNNGLRERSYRTFSSRLPTSPNLRLFQIGHPVLLSFAKILLELDDGEEIPIKINLEHGEHNRLAWMKLLSALQNRGEGPDLSYPKAVRGCLNLHSQLQHVDTTSRDSDMTIREKIFQHIVQHLEDSLESSLSPREKQQKRKLRLDVDNFESSDVLVQPCASTSGKHDIIPSAPPEKRPRTDRIPIIKVTEQLHGTESIANNLPSRLLENGLEKDQPHPIAKGPRKSTKRDFGIELCVPKQRADFEVAIICALPLEFDSVRTLFDECWEERLHQFCKPKGDPNHYVNGRIGAVDVVVLLLSEIGKVSAATATAYLKGAYPELQMVLLCGICGGIPSLRPDDTKQEVLLGDVIVSSNMIQYDIGRRYLEAFAAKQSPRPPKKHIQNMLIHLQTDTFLYEISQRSADILEEIQEARPRYRYPGTSQDHLFEATYQHIHVSKELCTCCKMTNMPCLLCHALPCSEAGCDKRYLVRRRRLEEKRDSEERGLAREAQKPSIFLGRFGSGDTVMKSSRDRDILVAQHGISALDMEGAGIWDDVPCIIVKGVCDYADSHKNKVWQDFASATSAAVVKALLERYIRTEK